MRKGSTPHISCTAPSDVCKKQHDSTRMTEIGNTHGRAIRNECKDHTRCHLQQHSSLLHKKIYRIPYSGTSRPSVVHIFSTRCAHVRKCAPLPTHTFPTVTPMLAERYIRALDSSQITPPARFSAHTLWPRQQPCVQFRLARWSS